MPNFIGLSGSARAGKDTAAKYLIENHGYVKVSFADPIREALYRLNPYVHTIEGSAVSLAQVVDISGWEGAKEISPEYRILMQRFGTEVGREMFGEDFWVNIAIKKAQKYEKVVFADCRYSNEADAIRSIGGEVWRVERSGVGPVNSHTSEIALDSYNFDRTILNNGSLENFYSDLAKIFNNN